MKRSTLCASLLLASVLSGLALLRPVPLVAQKEDEKPVPKKDDAPKVYETGHVPLTPEQRAAYLAQGIARHGFITKRIPRISAAKWDCRDLGLVPPVRNQKSCGSCWCFAGSCACTTAMIKAGYGKADGSFQTSEQYVLDCGSNGGCNGDDHSSVFAMAKKEGLPLDADYGPYQARAGRCKTGMKMYKIADWGYCNQSDNGGRATPEQIKNAMVQWGPISVAIAADNSFMNVKAGEVFDRTTSSGINHEVVLIGWDDTKGKKGAWLLRNSWGDWCDGGNCWIGFDVNGVGTDAAWVSATPIPPPPGPTPPTPPSPGPSGAPAITSPLTANAVLAVPFVYQITASNAPQTLAAVGLPAGFSCSTAGTITGTATALGATNVTLVAANQAGATTATLVLTVTATPLPPAQPVTITLTPEQVQAVISQSGGHAINPSMTLLDFAKLVVGQKTDHEPPLAKPLPVEPPVRRGPMPEKPAVNLDPLLDRLDKMERSLDRMKKATPAKKRFDNGR